MSLKKFKKRSKKIFYEVLFLRKKLLSLMSRMHFRCMYVYETWKSSWSARKKWSHGIFSRSNSANFSGNEKFSSTVGGKFHFLFKNLKIRPESLFFKSRIVILRVFISTQTYLRQPSYIYVGITCICIHT